MQVISGSNHMSVHPSTRVSVSSGGKKLKSQHSRGSFPRGFREPNLIIVQFGSCGSGWWSRRFTMHLLTGGCAQVRKHENVNERSLLGVRKEGAQGGCEGWGAKLPR